MSLLKSICASCATDEHTYCNSPFYQRVDAYPAYGDVGYLVWECDCKRDNPDIKHEETAQ